MKKIIGYLKDLVGKFFAKDAEGHIREIHPGDPVFEGEQVVNADGILIFVPDALRVAKSDQLETEKEEADVQTALGQTYFSDEESVTSQEHSKVPKPTVSVDIFEELYAELNIEATLRKNDFFTENTGLIRTPIEGEVDINAPLRQEVYFEERDEEELKESRHATVPVAEEDLVSGESGEAVTVDVLGNDSDPENDIRAVCGLLILPPGSQ